MQKSSKDSYSQYIQSQLNKFATFIAQSPMNQKRIQHIEDIIDKQQQRIYDLESTLKLNSIYLNENMNQMYRRKGSWNQTNNQFFNIEQTGQKNERSFHERNIRELGVEIDQKYQQLLARIVDLERKTQRNKSKSISKQNRSNKKHKQQTQKTIEYEIQQQSTHQLERIVFNLCRNNFVQLQDQIIIAHCQPLRKQFESYKHEIKKYFSKKFKNIMKTVDESLSNNSNIISENIKSIDSSSSKFLVPQRNTNHQVYQKQNIEINLLNQRNKASKRQSTTAKIPQKHEERKNVLIVNQFDYQTQRQRRREKQKKEKTLSRSKSNLSELSKQSNSSKQANNKSNKSKQRLKLKLQKLQKLCEIGSLQSNECVSDKNIKKKQQTSRQKQNVDKAKNKQGENMKQKNKSVSQSKSKSKSVSKSKPKLNKQKSKSKLKVEAKEPNIKSQTISLISLDSCCKSRCQSPSPICEKYIKLKNKFQKKVNVQEKTPCTSRSKSKSQSKPNLKKQKVSKKHKQQK